MWVHYFPLKTPKPAALRAECIHLSSQINSLHQDFIHFLFQLLL